MGLTLSQETLSLALRDPFKIARSASGEGMRITTVIVELRDDRYPGVVGVGEGYPDAYYGETPATMTVVLEELLSGIGEPELTSAGLVGASHAMDRTIRWNGAAKCALDIALHDADGRADRLDPRQRRRRRDVAGVKDEI